MKTCETCQAWHNKQMELGFYEGEGICAFAALYDTEKECNFLMLIKGQRVLFNEVHQLITGKDQSCERHKEKVTLPLGVPVELSPLPQQSHTP